MYLPELLPVDQIQARLLMIFPEGAPQRTYVVREMAARVVYVMLYVGAIEGEDVWLGPKHVYCMSDAQALQVAERDRISYAQNAWRPRYVAVGQRWYADTTRESIRDETLREGLLQVGAVIQKADVPTNSSRPRYCLARDFSALFDPNLADRDLDDAIEAWAQRHLTKVALARMALLRQGAAVVEEKVLVTLPNGSMRQLSPGESSLIIKAVVEQFAPKYLYRPAVVMISESGNKIVVQEATLAEAIGLSLQPDRLLPDAVLFDLYPGKETLVFVEAVATAGPVSDSRKSALLRMAMDARISPDRIAFVTAYRDRNHPAFRKTFGSIAWNTLVWFASEPDYVVVLRERPLLTADRIFDLLP